MDPRMRSVTTAEIAKSGKNQIKYMQSLARSEIKKANLEKKSENCKRKANGSVFKKVGSLNTIFLFLMVLTILPCVNCQEEGVKETVNSGLAILTMVSGIIGMLTIVILILIMKIANLNFKMSNQIFKNVMLQEIIDLQEEDRLTELKKVEDEELDTELQNIKLKDENEQLGTLCETFKKQNDSFIQIIDRIIKEQDSQKFLRAKEYKKLRGYTERMVETYMRTNKLLSVSPEETNYSTSRMLTSDEWEIKKVAPLPNNYGRCMVNAAFQAIASCDCFVWNLTTTHEFGDNYSMDKLVLFFYAMTNGTMTECQARSITDGYINYDYNSLVIEKIIEKIWCIDNIYLKDHFECVWHRFDECKECIHEELLTTKAIYLDEVDKDCHTKDFQWAVQEVMDELKEPKKVCIHGIGMQFKLRNTPKTLMVQMSKGKYCTDVETRNLQYTDSEDVLTFDINDTQEKYKLMAMVDIVRTQPGDDVAHYIAKVKRDNEYYKADDMEITKIKHEDFKQSIETVTAIYENVNEGGLELNRNYGAGGIVKTLILSQLFDLIPTVSAGNGTSNTCEIGSTLIIAGLIILLIGAFKSKRLRSFMFFMLMMSKTFAQDTKSKFYNELEDNRTELFNFEHQRFGRCLKGNCLGEDPYCTVFVKTPELSYPITSDIGFVISARYNYTEINKQCIVVRKSNVNLNKIGVNDYITPKWPIATVWNGILSGYKFGGATTVDTCGYDSDCYRPYIKKMDMMIYNPGMSGVNYMEPNVGTIKTFPADAGLVLKSRSCRYKIFMGKDGMYYENDRTSGTYELFVRGFYACEANTYFKNWIVEKLIIGTNEKREFHWPMKMNKNYIEGMTINGQAIINAENIVVTFDGQVTIPKLLKDINCESDYKIKGELGEVQGKLKYIPLMPQIINLPIRLGETLQLTIENFCGTNKRIKSLNVNRIELNIDRTRRLTTRPDLSYLDNIFNEVIDLHVKDALIDYLSDFKPTSNVFYNLTCVEGVEKMDCQVNYVLEPFIEMYVDYNPYINLTTGRHDQGYYMPQDKINSVLAHKVFEKTNIRTIVFEIITEKGEAKIFNISRRIINRVKLEDGEVAVKCGNYKDVIGNTTGLLKVVNTLDIINAGNGSVMTANIFEEPKTNCYVIGHIYMKNYVLNWQVESDICVIKVNNKIITWKRELNCTFDLASVGNDSISFAVCYENVVCSMTRNIIIHRCILNVAGIKLKVTAYDNAILRLCHDGGLMNGLIVLQFLIVLAIGSFVGFLVWHYFRDKRNKSIINECIRKSNYKEFDLEMKIARRNVEHIKTMKNSLEEFYTYCKTYLENKCLIDINVLATAIIIQKSGALLKDYFKDRSILFDKFLNRMWKINKEASDLGLQYYSKAIDSYYNGRMPINFIRRKMKERKDKKFTENYTKVNGIGFITMVLMVLCCFPVCNAQNYTMSTIVLSTHPGECTRIKTAEGPINICFKNGEHIYQGTAMRYLYTAEIQSFEGCACNKWQIKDYTESACSSMERDQDSKSTCGNDMFSFNRRWDCCEPCPKAMYIKQYWTHGALTQKLRMCKCFWPGYAYYYYGEQMVFSKPRSLQNTPIRILLKEVGINYTLTINNKDYQFKGYEDELKIKLPGTDGLIKITMSPNNIQIPNENYYYQKKLYHMYGNIPTGYQNDPRNYYGRYYTDKRCFNGMRPMLDNTKDFPFAGKSYGPWEVDQPQKKVLGPPDFSIFQDLEFVRQLNEELNREIYLKSTQKITVNHGVDHAFTFGFKQKGLSHLLIRTNIIDHATLKEDLFNVTSISVKEISCDFQKDILTITLTTYCPSYGKFYVKVKGLNCDDELHICTAKGVMDTKINCGVQNTTFVEIQSGENILSTEINCKIGFDPNTAIQLSKHERNVTQDMNDSNGFGLPKFKINIGAGISRIIMLIVTIVCGVIGAITVIVIIYFLYKCKFNKVGKVYEVERSNRILKQQMKMNAKAGFQYTAIVCEKGFKIDDVTTWIKGGQLTFDWSENDRVIDLRGKVVCKLIKIPATKVSQIVYLKKVIMSLLGVLGLDTTLINKNFSISGAERDKFIEIAEDLIIPTGVKSERENVKINTENTKPTVVKKQKPITMDDIKSMLRNFKQVPLQSKSPINLNERFTIQTNKNPKIIGDNSRVDSKQKEGFKKPYPINKAPVQSEWKGTKIPYKKNESQYRSKEFVNTKYLNNNLNKVPEDNWRKKKDINEYKGTATFQARSKIELPTKFVYEMKREKDGRVKIFRVVNNVKIKKYFLRCSPSIIKFSKGVIDMDNSIFNSLIRPNSWYNDIKNNKEGIEMHYSRKLVYCYPKGDKIPTKGAVKYISLKYIYSKELTDNIYNTNYPSIQLIRVPDSNHYEIKYTKGEDLMRALDEVKNVDDIINKQKGENEEIEGKRSEIIENVTKNIIEKMKEIKSVGPKVQFVVNKDIEDEYDRKYNVEAPANERGGLPRKEKFKVSYEKYRKTGEINNASTSKKATDDEINEKARDLDLGIITNILSCVNALDSNIPKYKNPKAPQHLVKLFNEIGGDLTISVGGREKVGEKAFHYAHAYFQRTLKGSPQED